MTSGEKAEPERSAISSSECPQGNGSHCYDHDPACCHCGKPRPECEHPNKLYTGSVYNGPAGRKTFLFYTCPDCKAHLKEEELDGFEKPEPSTKGDFLRCQCTHFQMNHRRVTEGGCRNCSCDGFKLAPDPEEPPLTPEEHNLGPEGVDCVFDACPRDPDDCDNGCRAAADELSREANETNPPPEEGEEASEDEDCPHIGSYIVNALDGSRPRVQLACPTCHTEWTHHEDDGPLPPQPDRRPPYLLAYSVQGHLYEIALPGDATVAALDGRLVITHSLGPVAGICQIAPIASEEGR